MKMSKTIYEEALNIIKQRINTIRLNTKIGSRTIADKENAILLDHIEYNLNRLCELVEKQEKLLNKIKEIIDRQDDSYIVSMLEVSNRYYEIEKLIKELENE